MAKPRRSARWTPEDDPSQERFRLLLLDLRDEMQAARGWQRRVAERLEMVPDHVSRVITRERRVSLATMTRAASVLGFSTDYFFVPLTAATTYRDHPVRLHDPTEQQKRVAASRTKRGPSTRELADRVLRSVTTPALDFEAAQELARRILSLDGVVHAKTFFAHGDLEQPMLPAPESGRWLARTQVHAAAVAAAAIELLGDD